MHIPSSSSPTTTTTTTSLGMQLTTEFNINRVDILMCMHNHTFAFDKGGDWSVSTTSICVILSNDTAHLKSPTVFNTTHTRGLIHYCVLTYAKNFVVCKFCDFVSGYTLLICKNFLHRCSS